MKKGTQRAMHCPCGRSRLLAVGLCATCYTLKRQDEKYFGGLREAVLKRDGGRCRVCGKPGGRKRSLAVHHRVAGKSELDLMITLCLAHHAMVTRTLVLLEDRPKLLRAWFWNGPKVPVGSRTSPTSLSHGLKKRNAGLFYAESRSTWPALREHLPRPLECHPTLMRIRIFPD